MGSKSNIFETLPKEFADLLIIGQKRLLFRHFPLRLKKGALEGSPGCLGL
jgi:hypothetical protein